MKDLCNIFNKATDNIIINRPAAISEEITSTLKQLSYTKSLRVNKNNTATNSPTTPTLKHILLNSTPLRMNLDEINSNSENNLGSLNLKCLQNFILIGSV